MTRQYKIFLNGKRYKTTTDNVNSQSMRRNDENKHAKWVERDEMDGRKYKKQKRISLLLKKDRRLNETV